MRADSISGDYHRVPAAVGGGVTYPLLQANGLLGLIYLAAQLGSGVQRLPVVLPLSNDLVHCLYGGPTAALRLPTNCPSAMSPPRCNFPPLLCYTKQAAAGKYRARGKENALDLLGVSAPLGDEVVNVEHVGQSLVSGEGLERICCRKGGWVRRQGGKLSSESLWHRGARLQGDKFGGVG